MVEVCKCFVIVLSVILSSCFAFAVEVISIDQSQPILEQVNYYCPWIRPENVAQVTVSNFEKIGWSGGSLSTAFGGIFENTGANLNFSNVGGNLPPNTQAVLLNTRYYNNNKQAEILVDQIYLIDQDGNRVYLTLDDSIRTLSQNISELGETLLMCFTNDENYVRVSARLTHRHVDGSRPEVAVEALIRSVQDEAPVP